MEMQNDKGVIFPIFNLNLCRWKLLKEIIACNYL